MTELLSSDERTFTAGVGGWTGGSRVSNRYAVSGVNEAQFSCSKTGVAGRTYTFGVTVVAYDFDANVNVTLQFYNGGSLLDSQFAPGTSGAGTYSVTASAPASTTTVVIGVSGSNFEFDPVRSMSIDNASLDEVAGPATVTATMTGEWGALSGAATASVSSGAATVSATLAAPFDGLTATATATVEHPVTMAGAWGELTATATATVETPELPAPDDNPGGGRSYSDFGRWATPRRTHHAVARGSWGGLTASAVATVSRDPDADLIELLLVGAI